MACVKGVLEFQHSGELFMGFSQFGILRHSISDAPNSASMAHRQQTIYQFLVSIFGNS